jgi:hypothetical protein
LWAVLISTGALAAVLVMSTSPSPLGYQFPPTDLPVVNILRTDIALEPSSTFSGRVATILPVKLNADDPWHQQFVATYERAQLAGNDEFSVGLWYYRIPTLFEYNSFTSPLFHVLIKRALQRPSVPYPRNVTVISYFDARVLKLLGVRYVLTPEQSVANGEVRASEERPGQRWYLIELSETNLATFSPTAVETRRDLTSTLDFVVDENVDLTKQAVLQEEIVGTLVPVRASSLSMVDQDLHIVAESAGQSLVVVPVEFSHCMTLKEAHPGRGARATLLRTDGLLSGILFEHALDALLSFRVGPLSNPLCRWQDYQEIKAMLH